MRSLATLTALYADLDNHLDSLRLGALEINDEQAAERIARRQSLNDQAYFILSWGQLESEIDDVCRKAIRKRQNVKDWATRRVWDLYNPDDKRLSGLSFEDRVALVVDRQAGKGSPWALVQRYYSLRNRIAHGKLVLDRIDLVNMASDFYKIQSSLSD